ncbi:periplasmic heavy metal sensor [bacterium SCSIO 12741]|nr:periplasmic heavy metal sensor [bacterium SCSIO 12741]
MQNRSRIVLILVVILVVLNVGVLSFFMFQPHHPPHPRPDKVLKDKLNLTEDQWVNYQALIQSHRLQMKAFQQQSKQLHDEFFNQFGETQEQEQKADSLASEIGQLQTQIERQTYQHFSELRRLLSDEQKKIFDQEIGKIMGRMMSGPPHPPKRPKHP